ncbi:MAG: hypothetical protein DRJ67_01395 [Thermoprotei archaeon]|nr:MAG: hypothetical protein DRJ67_01395 [Thermoprotei archaeon]
MKARARMIRPRPLEEARRYARMGRPRRIVISFTTDPYPPAEERWRLTRRVLQILAGAPQHTIMILTKNPRLALRDLDVMHLHGGMWLGATVIALDGARALEPRAPSPWSRLEALREAHEEGVRTWLSVEPIIPPISKPLEIVREAVDYVDFFVFGKLNYARQLGLPEPDPRELWDALRPALSFLSRRGKKFLVKRELIRAVASLRRGRPRDSRRT